MAKNLTKTQAEKIAFNLMRHTDGWLDIIHEVIPNQTESLWEFIVQESGSQMELKDIPEQYRTTDILIEWVSWNLDNIKEIPKELVSEDLKFKILERVCDMLDDAETEKELQERDEALEALRKKGRGITIPATRR